METFKICSQGFCSRITQIFGDFTSSFGRVRLRNVQNARAELFFCPLNILFCHVLVAVARSLISECSSVSYLRRYQSAFNKYLNQHQQKIKSGINSFLRQLLKCAFIVKLAVNRAQIYLLVNCFFDQSQ